MTMSYRTYERDSNEGTHIYPWNENKGISIPETDGIHIHPRIRNRGMFIPE